MQLKWKLYFILVGLVALIMVGYKTDVWASLTNGGEESQIENVNTSERASSRLKPLSRYTNHEQDILDEEFTVVDKKDQLSAQKNKPKSEGIIPSYITIPAIDVKANIEAVGVLDNGEMGVPENPDKAGWFEPGTKPGNEGNAVIAGHVDSRTGPAVFYDLTKLNEGDEITVKNKEGQKRVYVVQNLETYPQTNAPIKKVFGATDQKKLNLITCTGEFIRNQGGHQDRLVVYSTLKETNEEKTEIQAPTNVKVNGTFVSWHAVREDDVAGYRVYRSTDGEKFEKVASISAHERKAYTAPEASQYTYYVTTVDLEGNESSPSPKVGG